MTGTGGRTPETCQNRKSPEGQEGVTASLEKNLISSRSRTIQISWEGTGLRSLWRSSVPPVLILRRRKQAQQKIDRLYFLHRKSQSLAVTRHIRPYYFRVRAVTGDTAGAWSNTVTAPGGLKPAGMLKTAL